MFGLIFIYFIGKYFYKLAETHNRNKWLFAIFGIASYYAGTILGGVILGLISVISGTNFIDGIDDTWVGLMCLPFGVITVWIFFVVLKNNWSKTKNNDFNTIIDNDLIS